MPTFGSSCKHCGEVFGKGRKSLSAMRRFAEGSPSGVSARSTDKPRRRFVFLPTTKRHPFGRGLAWKEVPEKCRRSVVRASIAAKFLGKEGKARPQCAALPRGPLQGFRQDLPTSRAGGLSFFPPPSGTRSGGVWRGKRYRIKHYKDIDMPHDLHVANLP